MVRDGPPFLPTTCSYEFTEDVYESLCRAKKKEASYKLLPKLLLFLVLLLPLCDSLCDFVVTCIWFGADYVFDNLSGSLLFVGITIWILLVVLTVMVASSLYDCLYTIFVGRPRSWPASLDHEGPEGAGGYRTFLVTVKVYFEGIDIWYIPREDPDSMNAHSARKWFWSGPKGGIWHRNGEAEWDRVVKIDDLIVVLGNKTNDSNERQDTIWDAIILENAVMPASRLQGASADDLYREIKDRIEWAKRQVVYGEW